MFLRILLSVCSILLFWQPIHWDFLPRWWIWYCIVFIKFPKVSNLGIWYNLFLLGFVLIKCKHIFMCWSISSITIILMYCYEIGCRIDFLHWISVDCYGYSDNSLLISSMRSGTLLKISHQIRHQVWFRNRMKLQFQLVICIFIFHTLKSSAIPTIKLVLKLLFIFKVSFAWIDV